jgi:hypothetical protein
MFSNVLTCLYQLYMDVLHYFILHVLKTGMHVTAKINVRVDIRTAFKAGVRVIWCFTIFHASCETTLEGTFDLFVNITANWTDQITITGEPQLTGDQFTLTLSCHLPWYLSWLKSFIINPIRDVLHDALEKKLTDTIKNAVQKINVPSTFSPYRGVYFTYRVTDVAFNENDRILIKASCMAKATKKNKDGSATNVTFETTNVDAANTYPPTDWDLGPKNSLFQLHGVRLSSTILEAFFWAAQTIGKELQSLTFTN